MSQAALLVGAGILAGLIGSTAGLASLVSYPALLLIGLPPVVANVTNTVALFGSGVGALLASQPELRGRGRQLVKWSAVGVAGGATGAVLLLNSPPGVFERIVPFLVGGASILLAVQPRVRKLREARAEVRAHTSRARRIAILGGGIFVVSIYGGYFGAAAGVMMLALLLVLTEDTVPVANAMKSGVLWAANGIAALGFVIFGAVDWTSAIPLLIGCVLGSSLAPALVRRIPETPFRLTVAFLGLVLAVRLWVTA